VLSSPRRLARRGENFAGRRSGQLSYDFG
jgi:hypothetical protein